MDMDRQEVQAGLKKLETRLNKERGNQGPIQKACMGAGGSGRYPFNLPRDTGTRVPLPSLNPDLCELDPEEQCKRGEGGGGRKE